MAKKQKIDSRQLGLFDYIDKVRAQFILSINDYPEMRDVFHLFKIEPVRLRYTVGKDNSEVGKELLVTSF